MFFKSYNRTDNGLTVSFNIKPFKGPWGGSNQFVEQFASYLESHGYRVIYNLEQSVDIIWIIDQRKDSWSKPRYSVDDVTSYKKENPGTTIMHRANNCDARKKKSTTIDPQILHACRTSDYTIFISKWLKNYFHKKGLETDLPGEVIWNAGDAKVFNPRESRSWDEKSSIKLVTHHWSDNWMKGFDVYQQIDQWIANGQLADVELTVIGRWPKEINWKKTKLVNALKGRDLAKELSKNHIYITASRWEPGGMHFLEGLQCGLPVACHQDGGGITEVVTTCGVVFNSENVLEKLKGMIDDYKMWRKKALEFTHDGDSMCHQYRKSMERLFLG
ncbi:MAG: glycosyltransferase [Bacteroidota bacterium]